MLGKNIKVRRKEIELTQVELTEKLGVTQNSISNWIKGIRIPSIKIVISLAEVLNVNPGWLVGWSENKEEIE